MGEVGVAVVAIKARHPDNNQTKLMFALDTWRSIGALAARSNHERRRPAGMVSRHPHRVKAVPYGVSTHHRRLCAGPRVPVRAVLQRQAHLPEGPGPPTPTPPAMRAHSHRSRPQLWRLLTNFLFFGMFSLDFFFHMYFLSVRPPCRSLGLVRTLAAPDSRDAQVSVL